MAGNSGFYSLGGRGSDLFFYFLRQARGPTYVRTPEVKRSSIEVHVTSMYCRGLEYAELHLCFVIRLCVMMLNPLAPELFF